MVDKTELDSLVGELDTELDRENANVINVCREYRSRFEKAMNGHAAAPRVAAALQKGLSGTALKIVREEILAA